MSYVKLGVKVARLYLQNKIVLKEDIEKSYTNISSKYETMYLTTMHQYNDILLQNEQLKTQSNIRLLDLAGGTGYNCHILRELYPQAQIDLVDISGGMLEKVEAKYINVHKSDMLEYLKNCKYEYDMIVCSWAIIYSNPKKVIKECYRNLKEGGLLKIIVNKRDTLPEIREIYPKLLSENVSQINKLMLELSTPRSLKKFDSWFFNGFKCCVKKEGRQEFLFQTKEEAVHFVTSTGALAGYDVMLNLSDEKIKKQMAMMLRKPVITHSFAYGIYRKETCDE